MTLKSQVASIASDIGDRAESLPAQLTEARETLEDWRGRTEKFVRKNPVAAIFGAFAFGYVLAKVARHA